MVVFTCAHCGDSLQKPKVEKHYETKCRNMFPDVCCVDCLKDFRGDEFKSHTKCVSEAERYGGKGFVAKPNQNKGETKQNAWIEMVQSVLDENSKISGSIRYLLEKISQSPNTPRKKVKFINFVKSMDRRVNMNDIEGAWDLLSPKLELLKNVKPQQQQNGKTDENNVETSNKPDSTQSMDVDNIPNGHAKEKKEKNNTDEAVEVNNDLDTTNSSQNGELSGDKKKKSKKNKKREAEEMEGNNLNDSELTSLPIENSPSNAVKSKKSKKNKVVNEETNNSNGIESMEIVTQNGDNTSVPEDRPLTKKEKKEKKKREKYEAQLKEIEMSENNNLQDDISENKKSRKRKLEEDNTSLNGTKEISSEEKSFVENEPNVKKSKKDSAVEFDWPSAILSVLGSKGKDISLKKLQKRVISEYCVENNVSEITERIIKKFNKGLRKISNIKIENEKVRLVSEDE